MRSAIATIRRLLGALEELGRAEEVALACGDGVGFLALQHRAEPLVARITTLVETPAVRETMDETLLERGQTLIRDQQRRGTRLYTLLDHLRDEIVRIDQARVYARNLRPAYGHRRPSTGLKSAFAAQG